jgi:hypothetical protein
MRKIQVESRQQDSRLCIAGTEALGLKKTAVPSRTLKII